MRQYDGVADFQNGATAPYPIAELHNCMLLSFPACCLQRDLQRTVIYCGAFTLSEPLRRALPKRYTCFKRFQWINRIVYKREQRPMAVDSGDGSSGLAEVAGTTLKDVRLAIHRKDHCTLI